MTDGQDERASYTIRAARADDLSAVLRLHAPPSTPGGTAPTDRQHASWARMMATHDLTVYVAECESKGKSKGVVGNTCLLVLPNLTYDCRPTAFIEPVLVAASHRRRGVGRLMVERALDDARAASCYKVQLLSHKRHADDGAHDFYRSLGFEPEAEGFRTYLET